jgi:heterodisulfide reductase subunit C
MYLDYAEFSAQSIWLPPWCNACAANCTNADLIQEFVVLMTAEALSA